MKKLIFIVFCTLLISLTAIAERRNKGEVSDKEHKELLEKSPFNKMYPKQLTPAAAEYFGEFNNKLFAEGAIAPKEARLAAISASAARRCEYCITAQVHLAKQAGASDDEIKTAIQIAAEISRFSILLVAMITFTSPLSSKPSN